MVEKNEKNKGLFLGLAAATALVGAALLWQYVFTNDDDEEAEVAGSDIQAELEAADLATVKKAANGMLEPMYMCQLLNFVTLNGRKRREGERKEAIAQRRECFKNKQWNGYRDIIQEQFMAEDQMCQTVLREVLEFLTDLSEQEFQQTMQTMAQHPQYGQMLMAAQQGKLPSKDEAADAKKAKAPRLERAKTLTAL